MIQFYGIFQLVDVVKEDKIKNDGTKVIYFKAGSNSPGKDKGDIKFCKIYGKQAEYFINNLRKKDNGKYASRRLYLTGYIETYKKEEKIAFNQVVPPNAIPAKLGKLYESIVVNISKIMEREYECYRVTNLEFADSNNLKEELSIIGASSTYETEPNVENKHDNKENTSETVKKYRDFEKSLDEDYGDDDFKEILGI